MNKQAKRNGRCARVTVARLLNMDWRERQVFRAELQAVETAAVNRDSMALAAAKLDLIRKLDVPRGVV